MWMATSKLKELRKLLFLVMVNAMSSLEPPSLLSSGWGNGRSAGTTKSILQNPGSSLFAPAWTRMKKWQLPLTTFIVGVCP